MALCWLFWGVMVFMSEWRVRFRLGGGHLQGDNIVA